MLASSPASILNHITALAGIPADSISMDYALVYAGRAGTGFTDLELKRLVGVLQPLEVKRMPLVEPPPRENRFGSPLELSRVHWVRPELVVEVTYLTWTEGKLRAVSYQGQRQDKPARQVVRSLPQLAN
jgi:ATP-dependent DNA ligase